MRRPGYGIVVAAWLAGCGSDARSGLDDYLPPIPGTTGEAQQVFAGQVTDPGQLVTGPAQSGMIGDYFLKNDKVTFIIQAPTRVIGVIPQGGNLVDAVLTDGTHQTVDDHFGELGMLYVFGRTCEPTKLTIVRDGARGGVAVLEARGRTGNDDFLNIKAIGRLPVAAPEDPDIDDKMECATTYILSPGSTTLEVYHSLFNGGKDEIDGPFGTIADTGGNTEAFTNARGFERADISALATLSAPEPSDFVVYQGPGVAYGIVPRHATPTVHTQALIAGVSLLLNGNTKLLVILDPATYFLLLPPDKGVLQRYDVVVGRDASDVDAVFRTGNGEPLQAIAGHVTLGGAPAAGARVGVFVDGNKNGVLDDATVDLDGDSQPDDKIVSYLDVHADGSYAGQIPTTAGALFVRAEIKNVGRSPAAPVAATVNLAIPAPIVVNYQIVDDVNGQPIPGRLVVIGDHPAFPDPRVFETADRQVGVVTQIHAIRGTTTDLGDGVDPVLTLPAGGTYRIYASRGTEWSVASAPVTQTGTVTFRLRQVNPTPGYLATDWHVHQVGSPDSNVLSDERVRSAVSAGVELFAVTDHDYVANLQPIVEQLGVKRLLRVIPGIEITPFAYGHYQAWPLVPDDTSPNHGAIDWGRGSMAGDAMTPGEIYSAARARGARMLQVNHPRGTGFTEFQSAFQRANVAYDFDGRTRLPERRGAQRVPPAARRVAVERPVQRARDLEWVLDGGHQRRWPARVRVDGARAVGLDVDAVARVLRHPCRQQRHPHHGRRPARHAADLRPRGGRLGHRDRDRLGGGRGARDPDRQQQHAARRRDHRRADDQRDLGDRVGAGQRGQLGAEAGDARRDHQVARLGRVRHARGVCEHHAGRAAGRGRHDAGAAQVLHQPAASVARGRRPVHARPPGARGDDGADRGCGRRVPALRGQGDGHARRDRRGDPGRRGRQGCLAGVPRARQHGDLPAADPGRDHRRHQGRDHGRQPRDDPHRADRQGPVRGRDHRAGVRRLRRRRLSRAVRAALTPVLSWR